jgi:hypothetical protein
MDVNATGPLDDMDFFCLQPAIKSGRSRSSRMHSIGKMLSRIQVYSVYSENLLPCLGEFVLDRRLSLETEGTNIQYVLADSSKKCILQLIEPIRLL